MHHETIQSGRPSYDPSGVHFSEPLTPPPPPSKEGRTTSVVSSRSRTVLLLDPTPNRGTTAQALALAGWLPVSVNTNWQDCLEVALDSLNSVEIAAVVIEAVHPLLPQFRPPPSTTCSSIRLTQPDYDQNTTRSTSSGSLSAHELAGRLADGGVSPREIPFILYTTQPLALLSTPTQFKADNITQGAGDSEEYGASEPGLSSYYFEVGVERPLSYGANADLDESLLPFAPLPGSSGGAGAGVGVGVGIGVGVGSWGELLDPALTLTQPDDSLLAVLAHYTRTYVCRQCLRSLTPDEPALLVNFLQIWCRECAVEVRTASSDPHSSTRCDPGRTEMKAEKEKAEAGDPQQPDWLAGFDNLFSQTLPNIRAGKVETRPATTSRPDLARGLPLPNEQGGGSSSIRAGDGDGGGEGGGDRSVGSNSRVSGSGSSEGFSLSSFHRHFNRLYHAHYGFTPFSDQLPLYPANRLARAASVFVTGSSLSGA